MADHARMNYASMSYEELCRIADDDSIADKMSEEEYESLSVELWKKFGVERALTEHYPPSSLGQENRHGLLSIFNYFRSSRILRTRDANSADASAAPGAQLRELFRSEG
jgi:hypothetical protein